MILKRANVILILSAAAISVSLFMVKHQVQALDDELVGINRQIVDTRENIHVLKAEWSHLNQPARLKALASRYLEVGPVDVRRLGSAEHIIDPLPARPETEEQTETAAETAGTTKTQLQAASSVKEGTKP